MTRADVAKAMADLKAEEAELRAANDGKLTREQHIALVHAWAALNREVQRAAKRVA